jgi:hypothetical protein
MKRRWRRAPAGDFPNRLTFCESCMILTSDGYTAMLIEVAQLSFRYVDLASSLCLGGAGQPRS